VHSNSKRSVKSATRPKHSNPDAGQKSGSITDRVYEEVKLMAMTYRFRPGERINEVLLAEQLQVSRTPLREALNRLSSEGYISVAPNRGFIGRELDPTEIQGLFELRSILEQGIVRLACERASDEELEALKLFADDQAANWREKPTLQNLRDDEEFHLRIARMTGNAELVKALEQINGRIHFVRWIDLRLRPPPPGVRHNGEFIDMLMRRDADACAKRIATMINRRYDEIVEVIRAGIADIYVGAEF